MRGREPFLLGIIGAVLGIGLAVLVFGGGLGGGQASASASPARPGPSVSPAPSQVAAASASAAPVVTSAPSSDVPTIAPTTVPTAKPTAKPTKTPKPTPTPNTAPVIVSWDTPNYEDCTNDTAGSISVSWSVKRADGVTISIDGPGIYDSYDMLVREGLLLPYGCSHTVLKHTYTLTTVGGTGGPVKLTKTVRTRPPTVEAFSVTPVTGCGPGEVNATVRISYTVRAATGADLYRDGAIYANYTGKEEGPIPVPYPCAQDSVKFKLVTTGGYGPAASKTITVERPTEP